MEYEVVIGLEIHAELSTKSKIFCGCSTDFGGEVNTHCCPICTGMPGVLPVLNKSVVEYAVKAGLAMNCNISDYSKQDRKNYFYPDLPKAYQISQYDLPLSFDGHVDIAVDANKKRIGITRIHIEEDAAKLLHDEWGSGSLVDYNRCGVPLIEIVSEPDIRSAEEAKAYVELVKSTLQYIDVSDCKMQEGSLRADVNLSVRPKGQKEFGTRTEMKNLNSFKAIVRAIESETARQIEVIEDGGMITQETRRWDDEKGISYAMRSKEEAHDYRYFPDPDLVSISIDSEWLESIRVTLPELSSQKKLRFMEEYNLPEYDADVLTSNRHLADFYERVAIECKNPKIASNWVMGDLMATMNEKGIEAIDIPFTSSHLAELIKLIENNTISGKIAKTVFIRMYETGKKPNDIVEEEGLKVVSDEGELRTIVEKIIIENSKSVEDYKNGKTKAIGFLVGQVMKETKGKAQPSTVNDLLLELLN